VPLRARVDGRELFLVLVCGGDSSSFGISFVYSYLFVIPNGFGEDSGIAVYLSFLGGLGETTLPSA